jgi:hypothetical protein
VDKREKRNKWIAKERKERDVRRKREDI